MKRIKLEEGSDVTEVMGVKKHDPQAAKEKKLREIKHYNPVMQYFMAFAWFRKVLHLLGIKRLRNWPNFIKKTDETRVQNFTNFGKVHDGRFFYTTEKLDGQSGTFAIYNKFSKLFFFRWFENSFYVCSRNLRLNKENDTSYWRIARGLEVEKKLKKVGKNIAIQGEIIGEGIQKNKYKIKGIDFYVFNVYDIDKQEYYNVEEKIEFCEEFGFKLVPFLLVKEFMITKDMVVKDMVEISIGKSSLRDMPREGLVFRWVEDDRQSFKAINPEFLLQYGE